MGTRIVRLGKHQENHMHRFPIRRIEIYPLPGNPECRRQTLDALIFGVWDGDSFADACSAEPFPLNQCHDSSPAVLDPSRLDEEIDEFIAYQKKWEAEQEK